MTPHNTVKFWMTVGLVGLLLMVAAVILSMCSNNRRTDRNVAVATGKALDKVATETPIIRQEQQDKQREVDELQGADQRLPDGFGADLERVRRGNHSR